MTFKIFCRAPVVMLLFASIYLAPNGAFANSCHSPFANHYLGRTVHPLGTSTNVQFDETQITLIRKFIKTLPQYAKGDKLLKEQDYWVEFGMRTRWEPVEKIEFQGKTLLVLSLVTEFQETAGLSKPPSEFAPEFDVIVWEGDQYKQFEEAFAIPKRLVARVSSQHQDVQGASSYFVEFRTRASVIAALKSIVARRAYSGFSGLVVRGSKAEFDPTPGRQWKVVDAEFDLMRGSTAESLDIYAFQFDSNFKAYYEGAVTKVSASGDTGAMVAPWNAVVMELLEVEY